MFWTRPRIFGVSDSQLKGILPTLLFGKRPTKTGSSCPIDSLLSGSGEVRRVLSVEINDQSEITKLHCDLSVAHLWVNLVREKVEKFHHT